MKNSMYKQTKTQQDKDIKMQVKIEDKTLINANCEKKSECLFRTGTLSQWFTDSDGTQRV